MDAAGYTILLTAATVAAMILATFFFIGQKGTVKSVKKAAPAERKKEPVEVPTAANVADSSNPETNFEESPVGEEQNAADDFRPDNAEDAAGPIWPSVMTASDEDSWKVWFDQPNQSKTMSKGQFEESMKVLGTFNSMADFWDKFSNLMHEKLPTKSNVRVFQSNVRPLWEDPVNRDGGKWIVVVPKPKSVGVFNEVLAAMVSNKFECEISGLVLSKKVREDLVSIWTPSGLPIPSLELLRDTISKLLELHLGLQPEITFMSHDKKNKIAIAGKGEKEKKEKQAPQPTKMRFTGMKPARAGAQERPPKSPGLSGKGGPSPKPSPGMRPKSPSTAPNRDLPPKAPPGSKSSELRPTAWATVELEEDGLPPMPEDDDDEPQPPQPKGFGRPNAWGDSKQPKGPRGPAKGRGGKGNSNDNSNEGAGDGDGDAPAAPPTADGWEVVRSKGHKSKERGKNSRDRYKSL